MMTSSYVQCTKIADFQLTMHGVDSLEHAIVDEAKTVKVTMDTQYKSGFTYERHV